MNGNVTFIAWQPWKDSLDALNFLANHESPASHPHWRIYWIAGVTTLRAIGHVLDKVDRPLMPNNGELAKAWWVKLNSTKTTTKEPAIFHNFINKERNNILKEYRFGSKPHNVTSYTMHDRGLSYIQLVAKYGERSELVWGEDGYDSLEMLGHAII